MSESVTMCKHMKGMNVWEIKAKFPWRDRIIMESMGGMFDKQTYCPECIDEQEADRGHSR